MQTEEILEGRSALPRDDYASICRFASECNHISYAQFDAYTVGKVNLFTLRENYDFDALDEMLDRILRTLPAIKRIFARPITRLKDTREILPVESVRVVNNQTMVHAAVHSELWDDITEEGLKPRKLLTLSNEDNYSIYENVCFVQAVDIILHLVGKHIRLLTDMLYADRDMKFNLLERVNHPLYFLTIGKLHIGYVRDYEKYREASDRCLDKLIFIDRTIRARLNSPVYRQCKHHGGGFKLKKTNIFRMHKDYHRIYLLLKWFSDAKLIDDTEAADNTEGSGEGYGLYSTMLSIFAAGHFNFTFREDKPIDFYCLDAECSFDAWQMKIETVICEGIAALRFSFMKDLPYRVILLPATVQEKGRAALARFRAFYDADEYLLATPNEEGHDCVYLSLFDIESFRRVQQIIFRGMIRSDSERTVCPFCGRALVHSSTESGEGELYECGACRTQILDLTCPDTGRAYVATQIKNYQPTRAERSDSARRDKLIHGREIEAGMHFRNITEIGEGAELICPHCHKVHSIR